MRNDSMEPPPADPSGDCRRRLAPGVPQVWTSTEEVIEDRTVAPVLEGALMAAPATHTPRRRRTGVPAQQPALGTRLVARKQNCQANS